MRGGMAAWLSVSKRNIEMIMLIWFIVNTAMAVSFGIWQNNGAAGMFAWFAGAIFVALLLFMDDITNALLAISKKMKE
jgi:hypothetical protein